MIKRYMQIALLTIIIYFLSGCNDNTIMTHLTQIQANQVLAVLQQYNIPSQKKGADKEGYSIIVDEDDMTVALSIINQYQLPLPTDVQITQTFPDNSLVSSPNAERAKLVSLKELQLAQSIRLIGQVVNVKVNISIPLASSDDFGEIKEEHASVLIIYKGEINNNIFINQIKSLIKNGLDNIKYENISVVLFPQATIQYSQPIQSYSSTSHSIPIILIMFFLFVLSALGYFFYYQYILVKKNKIRLKNEENHIGEQLIEKENVE